MGLGIFINALRLRSAAKKYARNLGPQLIQDYGANETYNEAQIRAAIRKRKLPEADIKLGFAAFMPEAEFIKRFENADDYTLLRNLYHSFLHHQPTGESGEAGSYKENGTGFGGAGLMN
jgi:hypothetical protein